MYPLRTLNVPLGIHVPQFGNPCIRFLLKVSDCPYDKNNELKNFILESIVKWPLLPLLIKKTLQSI